MSRVVHFEITADDPERAVVFYKSAFGWEISRWGEEKYWLVKTGPDDQMGINGGILGRTPLGNIVNTIGVGSLDDAIEKVTAAGGQVVQPRMAIPGVGYLAYCKDTEGNSFGIMQPDSNAA
jgi:uncharacterized protein